MPGDPRRDLGCTPQPHPTRTMPAAPSLFHPTRGAATRSSVPIHSPPARSPLPRPHLRRGLQPAPGTDSQPGPFCPRFCGDTDGIAAPPQSWLARLGLPHPDGPAWGGGWGGGESVLSDGVTFRLERS